MSQTQPPQSQSHGLFHYLCCCFCCDDGDVDQNQRVATATTPLLREQQKGVGNTNMEGRTVTFQQQQVQEADGPPLKGILKSPPPSSLSAPSVVQEGGGSKESSRGGEESGTGRRQEEEDLSRTPPQSILGPPSTPGTPGGYSSGGSNPNSPVGGVGHYDYSQWGQGNATSSPMKKKDDNGAK